MTTSRTRTETQARTNASHRARAVLLVCALAPALGLLAGPAPEAGAGLDPDAVWDGRTPTAHEWGTFTTVAGSDGVVLGGLTHDGHELPDFVYDLTDAAGITGVSPKMETPVVYFYSDKPLRLRVKARFPRGVITQWYPAAFNVNHSGLTVNGRPAQDPGDPARRIDELEKGWVEWGRFGDLEVLGRDAAPEFPSVADDDPWRHCRETDANALRVCNRNARLALGDAFEGPGRVVEEFERCLFYRGLGDFPLPLTARLGDVTETDDAWRVALRTRAVEDSVMRNGFVIRVDGDRAGWASLGDLSGERDVVTELPMQPLAIAERDLLERVACGLVESGLYVDEALAMVNTWKSAWFGDDGVRLLCTLPREFVDRELPLKITEARTPRGGSGDTKLHVERVFVARIELLSAAQEADLEATVWDLAHGDDGVRAAATQEIARWGRFAMPWLERVRAQTSDAAVRRVAGERIEALAIRR